MTQLAQATDTVLMVRPQTFQFNAETAESNAFQKNLTIDNPAELANSEFDDMVATLRTQHIRVIVVDSPKNQITPDAVFPNNWFTSHQTSRGQTIVLYPMCTTNRRLERQYDVLKNQLNQHGIPIDNLIDLTSYETKHKYLEGTGSVILDRIHHVAYAAISPRTNVDVLYDFVKRFGYEPIIFHSRDKQGQLIYHTNVVMSIGTHFAVIALDSIQDADERATVEEVLKKTHKTVIAISNEQLEKMAANILELRSTEGKSKIILSQTAYAAFNAQQLELLSTFGDLVVVKIPTIETIGGGSARCMLAEIF